MYRLVRLLALRTVICFIKKKPVWELVSNLLFYFFQKLENSCSEPKNWNIFYMFSDWLLNEVEIFVDISVVFIRLISFLYFSVSSVSFQFLLLCHSSYQISLPCHPCLPSMSSQVLLAIAALPKRVQAILLSFIFSPALFSQSHGSSMSLSVTCQQQHPIFSCLTISDIINLSSQIKWIIDLKWDRLVLWRNSLFHFVNLKVLPDERFLSVLFLLTGWMDVQSLWVIFMLYIYNSKKNIHIFYCSLVNNYLYTKKLFVMVGFLRLLFRNQKHRNGPSISSILCATFSQPVLSLILVMNRWAYYWSTQLEILIPFT